MQSVVMDLQALFGPVNRVLRGDTREKREVESINSQTSFRGNVILAKRKNDDSFLGRRSILSDVGRWGF